MRRLKSMLFLALVGVGAYFFLQHFRIDGLEQVSVRPREPLPQSTNSSTSNDPLPPLGDHQSDTIRVASFNIQVFGASKLNKPRVANILADIVRRFDVVAIQEVRAKSQDILPHFIELVNSTGRHYDYVISRRLGRSDSKEQYAFVFDTATVEVDRNALYVVEDPDDLLHREPLVGWFRVRGPPADQAFTFSLIDMHTDPDVAKQECDVLGDVYRAVRDDRRGEDDVILLGDLNVDDRHLGRLAQISDIMWLISGVPTNTLGNKQYDNILFTRAATSEYTGRSGVLDMIREYNMTMEEAVEVSDHMPIWAEFSVYEGGLPGRLAKQPKGDSALVSPMLWPDLASAEPDYDVNPPVERHDNPPLWLQPVR